MNPPGPYQRQAASRSGMPAGDLPPVRFLEIKRIAVRQVFAFPSHRHATYEIFVPLAGRYECTVNGTRLRLGAGQALLVQPGDLHADIYQPGASFLIAVLAPAPRLGAAALRPEAAAATRVVHLDRHPRLAALVAALEAGGAPQQDALPTLEPLTLALFWDLVAALPPADLAEAFLARRQGQAFRAEALTLLAAMPASGFDADALAARLGLGRRAMELRFRRELGRPPEQALLALKADEAVRLLGEGRTVGETAEELGFANQFHFSRVFKRFTGRPPRSARRAAPRDMR